MKTKTDKKRIGLYIRESTFQDIQKASKINNRSVSNFMEFYSNIAAQSFLERKKLSNSEIDAETLIKEATNEKD
jgi:uncharacterized protein (DUF1778 family)